VPIAFVKNFVYEVLLCGCLGMKKVKLAIASVLAVVVIVPVVAYNIGVVSLYKSKGVDQNTGEAKDFRPVLQGGVDWTHASGFYVSNWNSTGKFGAANLELI
jgi:uncharacterized protein (TIGR02001 family)